MSSSHAAEQTGEDRAPAAATVPGEPAALTAEAVGARVVAGARWLRWRKQLIELLQFGTVGGIAFIVDVGLMNLLRFGPGEILGHKPLTAKVISVCVATLVAWIGNRYWTFSEKKRSSPTRELVMFLLVNAGGMLVAVGTLAVSHYVLGFTSPLADNIAANGVGLVLGTAFRYVCYRYLVFTGDGAETKPLV
ncbi:GtrA family protein [Georgenia wangjunii]|uniref:GtrA family protein n=1 Tax=Georgenia wangjunii TaxID=3117730 RepID=UPI002F264A27